MWPLLKTGAAWPQSAGLGSKMRAVRGCQVAFRYRRDQGVLVGEDTSHRPRHTSVEQVLSLSWAS